MTDELARRVAAIHPELAWHFGPGEIAEHCLTVSAGGVAAVRPFAERWFRAAPAADATWEFRPSQQAGPDALSGVLEVAGQQLELGLTRFRLDIVPEELRVHVGVYNPAFAQLPDPAPQQVTFLVLDWLLGEDDVERWLGQVETLREEPSDAGSGADLTAAVSRIAALRDPDEWVLAHWQDQDGLPGLASFRRGLRWIDNPTLDRHQVVAARYAAQENGLPADSSVLDELGTIESELEDAVGSRGILVGHESHRGVRTFHVYTDGDDQNIDDAIGDWARARECSVEAHPDPAWLQVRHFTG